MFLNRTTQLGLMIVLLLSSDQSSGQEKTPPPPADAWASKLLEEKFDQVQKAIRPQPGESRWMQVPWQTSLWKARQIAAAEGKPMFVWSGSGGAPCAPT